MIDPATAGSPVNAAHDAVAADGSPWDAMDTQPVADAADSGARPA